MTVGQDASAEPSLIADSWRMESGAGVLTATAPPLPLGDTAAARAPQPPPAARGPARPAARRGANIAYYLVLTLTVASVAWVWHGGTPRARGGTLAMGGAVALAALTRLVLPEGKAGMLASRGRFIDVVTLAALAAGLLVAGLMLPTPS